MLLDKRALLAAMVYVDLNPIRAGIACNLMGSRNTSIRQRCKAVHGNDERAAELLMPIWGVAARTMPPITVDGRERDRDSGRRERDRDSGRERDRDSGRERDRDSGRERDRDSGRERDRPIPGGAIPGVNGTGRFRAALTSQVPPTL